MTPTAKAIALFEACLKAQMQLPDEGARGEEDAWCEGGVMRRMQKLMLGSGTAAKSFANSHAYARLSANEKSLFVYDLVDTTRAFSSLNWVLNAGRKPLREQLCDEEFQALHGLPKSLKFEAASARPAQEHDLWSQLYV